MDRRMNRRDGEKRRRRRKKKKTKRKITIFVVVGPIPFSHCVAHCCVASQHTKYTHVLWYQIIELYSHITTFSDVPCQHEHEMKSLRLNVNTMPPHDVHTRK